MKKRTVLIIAAMRTALIQAALAQTEAYAEAYSEEMGVRPLRGAAVEITDDVSGYTKGQVGIYYGGNRLVIGKQLCNAAPFQNMKPASPEAIEQAVGLLSPKRVTSVMRNLVIAVHDNTPWENGDIPVASE